MWVYARESVYILKESTMKKSLLLAICIVGSVCAMEKKKSQVKNNTHHDKASERVVWNNSTDYLTQENSELIQKNKDLQKKLELAVLEKKSLIEGEEAKKKFQEDKTKFQEEKTKFEENKKKIEEDMKQLRLTNRQLQNQIKKQQPQQESRDEEREEISSVSSNISGDICSSDGCRVVILFAMLAFVGGMGMKWL
jgi:lipopolysaccharide export LptBFGC system permease protein LptF